MEKLRLELPTMYGDHHVIEVRRLLMALDGVADVYASSGFGVVEVTYDPEKIDVGRITSTLDDAGYLGELLLPTEGATAGYHGDGSITYFRHTAVYETARQVMSFSQNVGYTGRPLWPCPGVGPLRMGKLEEE